MTAQMAALPTFECSIVAHLKMCAPFMEKTPACHAPRHERFPLAEILLC